MAEERRRQRRREAEAEEPTWTEAEVPAQLFRVLEPYELGTESLVWLVDLLETGSGKTKSNLHVYVSFFFCLLNFI